MRERATQSPFKQDQERHDGQRSTVHIELDPRGRVCTGGCLALLCGPRSEPRQGSRCRFGIQLDEQEVIQVVTPYGSKNASQTSNRSRKSLDVLCPPGTPSLSGSLFFARSQVHACWQRDSSDLLRRQGPMCLASRLCSILQQRLNPLPKFVVRHIAFPLYAELATAIVDIDRGQQAVGQLNGGNAFI